MSDKCAHKHTNIDLRIYTTPHQPIQSNEKELLDKFFSVICDCKPAIYVTFNGDGFDWPFVDARAAYHG